MSRLYRGLWLVLLLQMLCCATAWAKGEADSVRASWARSFYLISQPQKLFFGLHIGGDYALCSALALSADATAQCWGMSYPTLALSTSLKWFVVGKVGKGFYLRPEVLGGLFFARSPMADHPYYGGVGFGRGIMHSISRNGHWLLQWQGGVKWGPPFGGTRELELNTEDMAGVLHYGFLSPASLIDLSLGVAYRF